MRRKIVAIWLSLAFIFSFVVTIVEVVQIAKGASIIYVDDVPGEGPDNPPENYTSIQDAIDNASVGDTVFVYNGTYYENVRIFKSINLIGESGENTTIHGGGSGDTVRITADGVELSGFTITGSGTTPVEDAGLELYKVNNCRIINNQVKYNFFYGIKVIGSGSNNYNNISNNNISSNSYYGIYFGGSHENEINNNSMFFNGLFGLFLDGSNRNIISSNIIVKNENGIACQFSDDNTFTDNILMYNNNLGIYLCDSNRDTFINNTMVEDGILIYGFFSKESTASHVIGTSNTVGGKPIYYLKNEIGGNVPLGAGQVILANCKNVIVENQELTNGDDGIELVYSSNNIIKENNVSSHDFRGIVLLNSHNNDIVNNNISYNQIGVGLIESNSNKIKNNSVFLNSQDGIQLIESQNNNITSNNISNNEGAGIDLFLDSNSNNISFNKISMNNWSGILIENADHNNIRNNSISFNNEPGIVINGDNNHVYHNNIIENAYYQAEDRGKDNLWDNGYPSGGNFWSDYDGVDYFNGPGQNISGSDGIGDTPYTEIHGHPVNSRDNYPFTTTLRNYIFLYEGWNLISIPYIQSKSDLDSILKSIKGCYDAVQWYNTTDTNDHWKHNHVFKDDYLDDLWKLDHKIGFWIHVIKPKGVLFEYFGNQPSVNQTIKLYPGWNLVGYPSLTKYNRTLGLNNIEFGRDINVIQWFDAKTKTWHDLGPNDCFIRGRGYWIHSNFEITLEVPL